MARLRLLAALLLAAGLSWGCFATLEPVRHYVVRPVPARAIVQAALSQLGKPYAYGGRSSITGFDCSGLVYWCYRRNGSVLPRTAQEQYTLGIGVRKHDLRAGDLVFFDTASGRNKPAHVGIMISHDRFIHSPSSGETVREDELRNNYWKRVYYGARRIE
ncbi:MAG TPA: C40 family peptidase [bacterium]|nr:C40 family peptidase [bacterium]